MVATVDGRSRCQLRAAQVMDWDEPTRLRVSLEEGGVILLAEVDPQRAMRGGSAAASRTVPFRRVRQFQSDLFDWC